MSFLLIVYLKGVVFYQATFKQLDSCLIIGMRYKNQGYSFECQNLNPLKPQKKLP